jgi:hypothetical protein
MLFISQFDGVIFGSRIITYSYISKSTIQIAQSLTKCVFLVGDPHGMESNSISRTTLNSNFSYSPFPCILDSRYPRIPNLLQISGSLLKDSSTQPTGSFAPLPIASTDCQLPFFGNLG